MRSGVSRRQFVLATAVTAASTLVSCATPQRRVAGKPAVRKPNVIIFYADQLRVQSLSCNGETNVATPNIDRLAREGVVFKNAVSTCPLCTPYRGMLNTGKYPTHTALVSNFVNINPKERSIAHAFADAGYHTGYIGKWHLSASVDTPRGKFRTGLSEAAQQQIREREEQYRKLNPEPEFVPPGPQRVGYQYWAAYNFHMQFVNAFYYRDTPERLIMPKFETDSETDMAIDYIKERASANEPFFLVVAPHPPHAPWYEPICPAGSLDRVKTPLDASPNVPKNKKSAIPNARAYYAMIANVDDNIGRLTSYLDKAGLAADTILVFTSDHGEMMGSHGLRAKNLPYEESVGIPVIMRWPKYIPAGHVSDSLHTPMDHMPTLLALAGVEVPKGLDGMDLSLVAQGKTGKERDAALMANYVSTMDFFDANGPMPEWRAVRTKTHTYIKWHKGAREELFDNVADRYQMNNLATNTASPLLADMRARLRQLLAEAHDEFMPGQAYADWFDDERNVIGTGLGPVRE